MRNLVANLQLAVQFVIPEQVTSQVGRKETAGLVMKL